MTLSYPGGDMKRIIGGSSIVGATSGATATVLSEIDLTDAYDYPDKGFDDNSPFETEGEDFIDFTEDNPWGGM